MHLGRSGAWRTVPTGGEAWGSPPARLAGPWAGSAIGRVAQRDPRAGSLLSHPRNPLPCGSRGTCGAPAAPARCAPCLAPRHPRLLAQLVRGVGRPCGGVRSQMRDSGVPSRPGVGEERGEMPAETPWLAGRAGRRKERLRRLAGPAGNWESAGQARAPGSAEAPRGGLAGNRMEAWPGGGSGGEKAHSRRGELYCYIKVPGPVPPERKTTCVRPARCWGRGRGVGGGGWGELRPESAGPNPASPP